MKPKSGYSEREHTADWELEIWAPDFLGLLEQAARGIYAMSGTCLETGPRQALFLDLNADDRESLLVRFLTELLVLSELERLAFDLFKFSLEGTSLHAALEGAAILSQDKEIKAVTYHNLSILETEEGLRVNIVLDV
jgi:SHS2 domain-containing protein